MKTYVIPVEHCLSLPPLRDRSIVVDFDFSGDKHVAPFAIEIYDEPRPIKENINFERWAK